MTPPDLVMHWLKLEEVYVKTISYAQNHEDILLARAFPHESGFYLDVGANHPVFHSVTKLFSTRGWTGINIEPSPPVFEHLRADRPQDLNLNVGIGAVSATLTFYETPNLHGWSTFRTELAEHYRRLAVEVVERPVPVLTLAEVCAAHVGDRVIDFLKIDAEGFERQVVLGADFTKWRPRVLLIENAWTESWESLVLEANYLLAHFDGLNRYYVRAEESSLLEAFRTPVNVLDNFVSHEYLRVIRQLDARAAAKTSFIDAIRADAPRVARKLGKIVRRLQQRRTA